MAQLPVFETSGNGANDLKELEVAKAISLGFWKGQILSRSKTAVGHPSVGGYAVIPNIRIDGEMKLNTSYGQKVESFLEILGMDDSSITEINNIWNQNRVEGIDMVWRESVSISKETFKTFYNMIRDRLPTIYKLEVRYTNLHVYPTTTTEPNRLPYEEIWLANTLLQNEESESIGGNKSTNDLMSTGSIKAYDELGVEVILTEEESIALKGLMIVDGLNVLDTSLVTKEGELAVYEKDGLGTPQLVGYRPNALITYSGTGLKMPSDAQIDEYVKYDLYESTNDIDYNSEIVVNNLASTFWQLTTGDTSGSFFLLNGFNKFTKKYFSISGTNIYPRVELLRSASYDDLIYIMTNYIEIEVSVEKKWYDGVVKFIGGIVGAFNKIIAKADDIITSIDPVTKFLTWTVHKGTADTLNILGIGSGDYSPEDVHQFILDNAFSIVLTIVTWGGYGAVAGAVTAITATLTSAITFVINLAVELVSLLSQLLAQLLYLIGQLLDFLLTSLVNAVLDPVELLKMIVSLGEDIAVQMKDAKEQEEFQEIMDDLEEETRLLEEKQAEQRATFNIEKDMKGMYTDTFDVHRQLELRSPFDDGQVFDLTHELERRY